MRFVHTGDFHIGRIPEKEFSFAQQRSREIFETFEKIVTYTKEIDADLLLIAGDLFDCRPKVRELKEVCSVLSRLGRTHVVITAGNHDYVGEKSAYLGFAWPENVTFIDSSVPTGVYFEDINTEVYGFSYHSRNVYDNVTADVQPENPDHINILMVHGGDAADVPIDIKQLVQSDFDYIALGHIHKPDRLAENMFFCGSPEPLDRNETGSHGFMTGVIEEGTDAVKCFNFVDFSGRKYIKKTFEITPDMAGSSLKEKVSQAIAESGPENYYSIVFEGRRDPDIMFDRDVFLDRKCFDEINGSGAVVDVEDRTVPDFDYDRMLEENGDNVIGLFISEMRRQNADDEIIRKALDYGVSALLGIE